MNRIVKVFYCLGFLSIPVICAPLLLPLVMAKVPTSSPQPVARPVVVSAIPPLLKKDTAVASWHRQQVDQSLLAGAGEINTQNTLASWHRQQVNQSLLAGAGEINTQKARLSQKATSAKATPQLEMKIAIANNSNLVIATSTAGVVVDEMGHTVKILSAGQGFSAIPADQKIEFKGNNVAWQTPASVWIRATEGGFVYVGQHWYRGRVHLILQGFSLLAVNHVNLDDYLYSVVGSEMPSHWPLEALKAQAIAARSYALAHYIQPASSLYHMGSDQASQVYKGLDGEAGSTHQAVNLTVGEFLSYQGGVVESLYADTDEVVIKAHGGLGMSQTGAMQLANKGYDYLHILGAYYPGTSLAKLKLKG